MKIDKSSIGGSTEQVDSAKFSTDQEAHPTW